MGRVNVGMVGAAMAAWVVAGGVREAAAGVVYTSQARSVSGTGWISEPIPDPPGFKVTPMVDAQAAPDFGPFVASANLGSGAKATQNSVLGSGGVVASGSTAASSFYYKNSLVVSASSKSLIEIAFTLDEPTAFQAWGTLQSSGFQGFASGSFGLKGPGIDLFFSNFKSLSSLVEFNEAGVLQPGAYTLTTGSYAGDISPFDFSSSYTINFTIPAPGPGMAALAAVTVMAGRRGGRRRG